MCNVHVCLCVIIAQSGLSLGAADGLVTLSADDNVSIVTTENGDMIQIMSDSDAIVQETPDPRSTVV